MIPWREIQKESFTKLDLLADFLQLDDENRSRLLQRKKFPLLLPKRLASKIPKNCLDNPLARQFIPTQEEEFVAPGFVLDPVQDTTFQTSERLLQKYRGRVLLLPTGACAMHCRYCFRQNYPYQSSAQPFDRELDAIRNDTSIHEVILSGGDPLSLSDEQLGALMDAISLIDHVQIIRFHTRFMIGIPERITESFLAILKRCKKQIVYIMHINHADELDDDVLGAAKAIGHLGIPLLTQSVLLHGVNDDEESLAKLFLTLVSHGIMPYYLHELDPVAGAQRFYISTEKGLNLIDRLTMRLPGYALPKFVREVPNQSSKVQIRHTPLNHQNKPNKILIQ